jgi:hypothetical protein
VHREKGNDHLMHGIEATDDGGVGLELVNVNKTSECSMNRQQSRMTS